MQVEWGLLRDLLLEHLDVVFEALKGDEDNGEVVQAAVLGRGMQNLISNHS